MLQIASGKLFSYPAQHKNELRGVLYTNIRFSDDLIETAAGNIAPTSALLDRSSIIYTTTELIESSPRGKNILHSRGIDPYMVEFSSIVSFALNAICTPDAALSSRLKSGRVSPVAHDSPKKLIRRFFDEDIWCNEDEVTLLKKFVSDLLSLNRKSYRAAIRAINTFVTGMHRLPDDQELSYTLLVASLESLAQNFDGHRSSWADLEDKKRLLIEKALEGAEPHTISQVKSAILEIEHVSLARRFRDFTISHLKPSYFREDAPLQVGPIARTELSGALIEAYRLRSKYVHNLLELPKQITLGNSFSEFVRIDGKTFLTFQGLSRLARHVIFEFVQHQPKTDKEPYDYKLEQPGVIRIQLSEEYWIGRAEGLSRNEGRIRLTGFLNQLTESLINPETVITDLRNMLVKAETLFPQMSPSQRLPFLAIYFMFNRVVSKNVRMSSFPEISKKYAHELDAPSVESMFTHLILEVTPEWSLETHKEMLQEYFRSCDRKSGIKVPRLLEAGITLVLADRYRLSKDMQEAKKWISFAVENHPGNRPLLELEQAFDAEKAIAWQELLLPKREPPADSALDETQ